MDRVVRLLAAGLGADMCSVFTLGNDNYLELSSTWGLASDAVHKVRLHISEGIIGETVRIRSTLYIPNVKDHKSFLYHPEVGEDELCSYLGIPIIRHDEALGVVCLQTVSMRTFSDQETELVEIASLVVGDILEQAKKSELHFDLDTEARSLWKGKIFAQGPSLSGRVLLYGKTKPSYKPLSSLTIEQETDRFLQAVEFLKNSIHGLQSTWNSNELNDHNQDSRNIFETYTMYLEDPSWQERVENYIRRGFTSSASVKNVLQDMEFQFQQLKQDSSPWILEDLRDISQKLFFILQNQKQLIEKGKSNHNVIVVAKHLGPGDLLTLNKYNVKGIILEHGGPSSHVVLLAKSMNIPLLGWAVGITDVVSSTDTILLDTKNETAIINPSLELCKKLTSETHPNSHVPITSTPKLQKNCRNKGYQVLVNLGLMEELSKAGNLHVDGVGLFRTEILFMKEQEFPSTDQQASYYGHLLKIMKGKKCCIRTLDIGSDKHLPYFKPPKEANPALGWRSIRISLDRHTIFRHQLRALIRAANSHGPLDILFPLVCTAEEFFNCRDIYQEELARLNLAKKPPIRLGVMIETPASVMDLVRLKGHVEYLSLGTNDLFQFFFACDRGNPNVAYRYDRTSHSFLLYLKEIREKAHALGMNITVCGDMGSIDGEIQVLAALGYTSFSVMPETAPSLQKELSTFDRSWWEAKVNAYIKNPSLPTFKQYLQHSL